MELTGTNLPITFLTLPFQRQLFLVGDGCVFASTVRFPSHGHQPPWWGCLFSIVFRWS